MGNRLKEQLPLLLLGGISLASLALVVFFAQAAQRALPPKQINQAQQTQQLTDSEAFRLALQPPAARSEMLQQLISSNQSGQDTALARYLLATDLLAQGNGDDALATLEGDAMNEAPEALKPYVLLKQGQAQTLTGEAPNSWNQLLTDYKDHSATAEARYELGKQEPDQWTALLNQHPSHPRSVEVALQKLKTGTSKD
ncbi:MAG: tail length tape measure protein, partial [Cyanobacteria bacterium P01_D01_bin.56]